MNDKNSFLKGTMILMIANAISKILGAIFKIPLTYILEEEGMAIFNTAMGVYSTVLSFIISGLPLALSRYVAEENAMKNYYTVKKTVKICTFIFCVAGIIGSLILYFFADFFALSMKDPKATLAIKAISPAVFFVAWGAVYKSYFQGRINMIPTAVSQVIESFVRLFAGVLGAYYLRNAIIEITSAGAITGMTVGEIIATAVLFIMFIPDNGRITKTGTIKSTKDITKSIFSIAVPMVICSCISAMMNLLDVAMIRNSLLKMEFTQKSCEMFLLKYSSYTSCFDDLKNTLKLSIDGARWLFGAYSGYAMTVFNLPVGIIGALGVSILPVITGALAKNDKRIIINTSQKALRITLLIAFPSAIGLGLFGEQILDLLFSNTASEGMLRYMSPGLVFVCVSQLFIVLLHADGRIFEPFLYSMCGVLIKLCCNIFLVGNSYFNINGAITGTVLGYFVVMILCGISVCKNFGVKFDIIDCVLKPFVASIVLGLIMKLLYNPMYVIFGNSILSLVICVFVGGIGYVLSLISLKISDVNLIKKIP